MVDPNKGRASTRLDALASALEQKLENESGVLELLLAAHARGQNVDALWDKLHDAAQREDRLAELAFAYERFSSERRIKTMAAAAQAKLLQRAGFFFADVFGDAGGAEGYLERALGLVPSDSAVFDKLESLLVARHDGLRLSELYTTAAGQRANKEDQLGLLKRAAELVDGFSGAQDRALKLYQDIVRLDPTDATARDHLAARYASAGRHQDLARLLEQTLLAEGFAESAGLDGAASGPKPGAPEALDAFGVREKLLQLYAGKLGEIERALPHVEEILRASPAHKQARDVADRLLSHKAIAARVAALLDAVHERLGNPAEAARMLSIQIDQLRGPKRIEAQKRLALLHTKYPGELGDRAKALALHEPIVLVDPGDDPVRERYLSLARELDKRLDATRVLSRASNGSKDPVARARIGVEVGELFLSLGDPRKARMAFQGVLEAGGDDKAVLDAARAMDAITTELSDKPGLAGVLARLADLEPDDDARLEATVRLAALSEELRDAAGAVAAYKRLVGSTREGEALVALERLLEASGAHAELAVVLRRRAAREPDREISRSLSFRAAELRTKLGDRAAALEAWRAYVASFGPSRDALARLVPLLEQEKAWDELAGALEADAQLAPVAERPPILARLGQLKASRLADPAGALAAYARALAIEPNERTSRVAVERLLAQGDQRIAAADVLEPIARGDKGQALLVKVLEARGAAADRVIDRLNAMSEAADVAANDLRDPKRAAELAARGLEVALDDGAADPPSRSADQAEIEVGKWLERFDGHAAAAADPARTAALLKQVLADRAVDSGPVARVARRAGEALVASGDVAAALDVFRAALAFEPSDAELLHRVDTLLREEGSPEERLALYRAALEQPCDAARRRELLHAIGAIERRDLADAEAARATFRRALDEDPGDRVAFEALTEIHEAAGAWASLYDELERALSRGKVDDRTPLVARMAHVARRAGRPEQAAEHYAEILNADAPIADDVLAAMDSLADEQKDAELAHAVLERRLSAATEPIEEATWLEKLGDLEIDKLGRSDAALGRYRKAADRALAGLDAVLAERLYERVLALAPGDRGAAEKLLGLYRDAGRFTELARIYPLLIRATPERAEAVELLLAFEPVAIKAAALGVFVEEVDALLSKDLAAEPRRAVRTARARVLAADPETVPRASAAYRQMIEEGDPEAIAAFEAFLTTRGAAAIDDRRWLLAFRVERAEEMDQVRLLLSWAQFEEGIARDPARACELYFKVLGVDPEHDEALAARARLLRDLGDLDGAAAAIAARRDKSEGPAKVLLELELGELYLDRLDRPDEALDAIGEVLEASPADAAALRLVERALAHPRALVRPAGMLEKAADAVDDPELSAQLVEVLLSTPLDAEELLGARRGWFERLLDRPNLAPEKGLELALRAVRELPLDATLWDRAEKLGRALGKPDAIADAYKKELARLSQRPVSERRDSDGVEEVGRRAVEFLEEWFDDPEGVIIQLRRVVELVPMSGWAFERLKLVYNLAERWDELFTLYDRVIAEASEVERTEVIEDAAFAAKDLANDTTRATAYFEALLPLRREARIQGALERLYERQGKHRELIVLLTPDLGELQGEAGHRLRVRLAELWLDGVDDPASALELAEPLLNSETMAKEGLDLLERILRAATETSRRQAERATSKKAATLLRQRYEASERHADLARVLAIELEASDDPVERAERLRAIVRLRRSELADDAGAFDALSDLVILTPEDADARNELAALGARLGAFARLGDVLAAAAERTFGPLRTELLAQAAAIFDRDVGDSAKAISLARSVLGAASADPAAALRAARELDRLLAQAGFAIERCDVLDRLAELETDPEARRAAYAELGTIALRDAGDAERAVRAFRQALAIGESDAARDGLATALESAGRIEELVLLLEDRATRREGIAARADRARVARLLEHTLGDVSRAISAWKALREKHGRDDESADALALLLERAARWDELIDLFEAEASDSATPERTADLWRRLGDLHREHTLNWGEAVSCYELAFETVHGEPNARKGLEALAFRFDLADPEQRPAIASAVAALVRLAVEDDEHGALLGLLEPRVGVAATDAERVAVLIESSRLFEQRGDAAAAFEATWRALAITPVDLLASESARLATAADHWATIDEGLAAIDGRDDSTAGAIRILAFGVARYREDRSDFDQAERALERALMRDVHDVELLEALAVLQRKSPGRALLVTLLRLSEAKGGDLDALREAVDVAFEPVDDRALAKTLAEKLLDAAEARWLAGDETPTVRFSSPSDAAAFALDVLARLLHDETPKRLVDLFLRGARLPFDGGERRRLRLRAAEIADQDQTIAIYEQLFSEDPTDVLATDRLEELYRAEGKRAELLVLRKRQIAVADSAERKVVLRHELACLLADAGEAQAALNALRENLGQAPGHGASAAKLSELLEAGGLFEELASHVEDQAGRAATDGDDKTAAALFGRAAEIAETRLRDVARAIEAHRQASSRGATSSLDALSRLHAGRGEHRVAAEMLEKLLGDVPIEARPALALRLTDALVAAGEGARARERLAQAAVELDAASLRERLAGLYREAGDHRRLADLLADEATRAPTRSERARLLSQAAELYADQCKDPAAAVPLLEQARELAPDDLAPKLALSSALAASGRLDEASKSLASIIDAYGGRRPKERALVHFYLARVSLAAGDRARALGELDVALRIDPAHPEILHALARLAFEENQLDRANRTYRALLLVVRRPKGAGEAHPAVSRAEVLLELSEIAERLEDSPRAAEHLASAFEASRESGWEQERLFRALRERGRFGTLASALEDRISAESDPKELAAALGELADLYEGPLARAELALTARLRAMTLAPDNVVARNAALELARRSSQVERYTEALDALVESPARPELAADLLLALGAALEVDVKDDGRAASAYARAESALEAGDGRLQGVWRALERIHQRLGDHPAHADVLVKRIEASAELGDEERADPLYRLAALRLGDATTLGEAFDLLERALGLAPDIPRATEILRAALERSPDSARLLRFAERFAREHGDRRALVDALLALADRAARAKIVLAPGEEPLREAVDIAIALEDRSLAEMILRRVLGNETDPRSRSVDETVTDGTRAWAMIALAELAEAAENIAEAADLREHAAPHFDPEEERQLLIGVAAAAAGPLADLDRAARIYGLLREREPADRELWAPLADVYRRRGDIDKLAALLAETAPLVDDNIERAALGLERAKIVMKTDEKAAAELLAGVLEDDASQIEAAMLLVAMLEKAGRTDELADLLAKQLEAAKYREDVPSILSLSVRLGALLEQQDRESDALDIYHAALDWDKGAREILRAVLRLAFKRDDSMDIGDALEQSLAIEEGDEAVELSLQLAALRGAHGDSPGAEKALEQGFLACPTSDKLREELGQRYAAREAWTKLAALHIKEAEARKDATAKVEAFCRAADVLRQKALDAAGAADILRRALEVDPKDRDVLMALLDAYGELKQHDRAIDAVGAALTVDADDAWLYRSRAALYETLGRDQLALVDLERAYEKSGGGYASELVQQLERAVAWCAESPTPEAKFGERGLRLRAAEVLLKAGETDRARAHLTDLVRRDPKDRVGLRRLAELESHAARWDAASATLRKLLALEDGEALVEVALLLADACEKDGRLADARGGLERALRVAPGNADLRARVRMVYNVTGASRELAQMILEDAAAAPDVAGRFTHLLHAGRLLLDSDVESDLAQATTVLEQARGLRPEEPDATLLLSDAYGFIGRRAEARALLEGMVAQHKGRRARQLGPVYRRMARLDREDNDFGAAFAHLVKAFENDSHSGPLAMELGSFALERGDLEIASRAFRAVTLMKLAQAGSSDGTTQATRAVAYFQLGRIASAQGDRRKARLMLEKAASEDPQNEEARSLLDEMRAGGA